MIRPFSAVTITAWQLKKPSVLGTWAGGKFEELAPFSGEVNDLFGGIGGEIISNKSKDKVNEKKQKQNLVLIEKNSFATKSLFKEMTAQGIKFAPENVVGAAKDNAGEIIFLEKGNSKAGLQHIVEQHGIQFAQTGVSEARIPSVVMKAVTDGKIVGYQGTGAGRPIYEKVINDKKYNITVTVGNNGYIVGANLRGSVK